MMQHRPRAMAQIQGSWQSEFLFPCRIICILDSSISWDPWGLQIDWQLMFQKSQEGWREVITVLERPKKSCGFCICCSAGRKNVFNDGWSSALKKDQLLWNYNFRWHRYHGLFGLFLWTYEDKWLAAHKSVVLVRRDRFERTDAPCVDSELCLTIFKNVSNTLWSSGQAVRMIRKRSFYEG